MPKRNNKCTKSPMKTSRVFRKSPATNAEVFNFLDAKQAVAVERGSPKRETTKLKASKTAKR